MKQHGKTEHLALHAFRREHDTEKSLFEGITQFPANGFNLSLCHFIEASPKYFFYLTQNLLVQG